MTKTIDEKLAAVLHKEQHANIACQRMRVALAVLGKTPSELAEMAGFSRASLQMWTVTNPKRQRQARFSNLLEIAPVLGVPITFFCRPEPFPMVAKVKEPESWRDYVSGNRSVFAQRVRVAMAAAGVTPASLSRDADISRYSIDDWCRETATPNRSTIEKFAKATGAPLGWLAIPFPVVLS